MKALARAALSAALVLGICGIGGTPARAADPQVSFPNAALRTCVSDSLTSAGLPAALEPTNLARLTTLECAVNGAPQINDLTGLDHLTGLKRLYLFNTAVTDVSPLAALTGLWSLEFYSSELTDASALSQLIHLESLRLNAPKVASVGYVSTMAELTWVDLAVGPTLDLTPVWARTDLEFLGIPVEPDSDLSPLPDLSKLKSLQLHSVGSDLPTFALPPTTVSLRLSSDGSLASIANLPTAPQLTYFEIWQAHPLQSLHGLEGLTGLTTAIVQGTALSDVSAVSGLTHLKTLSLDSGTISDVTPLAGLTGLTSLSISTNKVIDISPLRHLTALQMLSADGNRIADLSPLVDLTELRYLGISNSTATDPTPLASLTQLQHLQWWYPAATDVSPLAGLEHLTWLEAPDGHLTTLGPPGGLKHLTIANFAGNDLQSIAGLQGASKLTRLDLSNNWQLSDVSPLSSLPGNVQVSLFGDAIKDLSPLPDTVTYTAHRQNAYFASVLAGSSTDLGIRDIAGKPLCPTFSTSGPTCTNGVVTYPPTAGRYDGTVGSGEYPGPGLGMKFGQSTYTAAGFNTTYQPVISGVPTIGRTLRASVKPWFPVATSIDYQWRRAGEPIKGAASAAYLPRAADRGSQLSVCVTGHRYQYNDRTRCSKTGARVAVGEMSTTPKPSVTGTPVTDAVLAAVPHTWDEGAALAFQWQKDHRNIKGATASTYKVRPGDVGHGLRVRVIGSTPGYHSATRYSSTVHPKKATFTAAVPAITGEPTVGLTLTAEPGTWAPQPSHLSYQWYRNGTSISRATKSTYRLTAKDRGLTIRVRVTATRAGYTTKRSYSVPTAPVT